MSFCPFQSSDAIARVIRESTSTKSMSCTSLAYHIYVLGDNMVHFDVDKCTWTIDEIADMADTLKSFVYDTEIQEFKRLGRFDIVEKLQRETK